jgi:hypothetical protein
VQPKHHSDLFGPGQHELAQTNPLLDPDKQLLGAGAGVDRFDITLMASGTAINRGTARAVRVLRNLGYYDPYINHLPRLLPST